jgi:two-component system response regulator FlrC
MNNLELIKAHDGIKTFDRDPEGRTQEFVIANPQMLRIIDIARCVAQTDIPILILGESGVGKDVLTGYIHRHSDRAHSRFVRVNCADLPDELLKSEPFGYEQGAFTVSSSPN